MTTRLLSRTVLAALAAVGVFLPFGAALPGVAGAAPSSSSAAKLRECLRASADLHQTTFGGRYVTAEDVARCIEAFRPGSSGGVSKGGNASAPKSTAVGGSDGKAFPERFAIEAGALAADCRVSGNTVTCEEKMEPLPAYATSWAATFTGTLSGSTLTGTERENSSLAPGPNTCGAKTESSGPVTYVFGTDGTVKVSKGVFQTEESYFGTPSATGGNCSINPPRNYSLPGYEFSATWSAIE